VNGGDGGEGGEGASAESRQRQWGLSSSFVMGFSRGSRAPESSSVEQEAGSGEDTRGCSTMSAHPRERPFHPLRFSLLARGDVGADTRVLNTCTFSGSFFLDAVVNADTMAHLVPIH